MKFLLAYRTTPQSSTGVTPAFIMFGRELRTKLPELRNDKRVQDECVRDWNHKLAGKRYADNRRCGKSTTVLPGDRVLLKNSRTTGQLATNFEQTPYVVERREGNELTVRSREGVAYRRSSSFVKPYTPPDEPPHQPEATVGVAITETEHMCANNSTMPRRVSTAPLCANT